MAEEVRGFEDQPEVIEAEGDGDDLLENIERRKPCADPLGAKTEPFESAAEPSPRCVGITNILRVSTPTRMRVSTPANTEPSAIGPGSVLRRRCENAIARG